MPFKTTKIWIRAARLRTLPLSISGVIVGNALCVQQANFSWLLFVLMLLTAVTFQIVSNLANDYGDGVKGTDNANRIGPERVLQSGLLSRQALKKGIVGVALVSLLLALILITAAFGSNSWMYFLIFLGLAIFSIWAAISYTVGDKAYGYRGLGDVFVFVFFGLVSVMGAYFLQLKEFSLAAVAMAVVVGLLSVAVLNLNNMRDRESDAAVGKRTLAVLLGALGAKYYHYFLIGGAVVILIVFSVQQTVSFSWLVGLGVFPLLFHLLSVIKNKDPKTLDPELKKVALATFALSLLIFISYSLG
jgi:1,4-dihydroxy-2-naphthoate octaprenyltransferase